MQGTASSPPSATGRGDCSAADAPLPLRYPVEALGRVAQRESARFTRGRSLVRSQPRPLRKGPGNGAFCVLGIEAQGLLELGVGKEMESVDVVWAARSSEKSLLGDQRGGTSSWLGVRVERLVRRFLNESGHYFLGIGLALIGLGVYLEVASKSSAKHSFAAMAFAFGALWLLPALWYMVEPRLGPRWEARKERREVERAQARLRRAVLSDYGDGSAPDGSFTSDRGRRTILLPLNHPEPWRLMFSSGRRGEGGSVMRQRILLVCCAAVFVLAAAGGAGAARANLREGA